MPQDKSIISLPSTSKTVVLPNVATNITKVRYNEGIYITDKSAVATYPKSVVRVYKNQSNPKKVYLAAKDTSLLENFVLNLVNSGETKDSSPDIFRASNTQYFWDRAGTEDSYRDFSLFSQPYNLDIEPTRAKNKKMNFYSLPLLSRDTSYLSSLNTDTTINNNFLDYGLFLKSKSITADYENYDTYLANKYIKSQESATSGERSQKTNFLNRASLYQKFLYNNYEDISKISSLYETDLSIFENATVQRVNTITFADFISNSYNDILPQKIIVKDGALSGGGTSTANTYVLWKDSKTSPNIIIRESTINSSDRTATPNFTDGLPIESLLSRYVYFTKNNYLVPTIKDVEMVDNTNLRNVEAFLKEFAHLYTTFEGSRTNIIEGALLRDTKKVFSITKELNLDDQVYYTDNVINTTEDLTDKISNFYVFEESFNYNNYLFVPADPNETIYEFELDKEVDIPNGCFVVAEIE